MNTIRLLSRPLPASVANDWVIFRSFLLTPIVLFVISVPIVFVGNNDRSRSGESLFVLFVLLHVGWYVGGALVHLLLAWLGRRNWWHYATAGFFMAAAVPLFGFIVPSIVLRVGNPEASALQLFIAGASICAFFGAVGVANVSIFWWLARGGLQNAP